MHSNGTLLLLLMLKLGVFIPLIFYLCYRKKGNSRAQYCIVIGSDVNYTHTHTTSKVYIRESLAI